MKMPSQLRAQGLPNIFLEGSSNWQDILVHGGAYPQPLELNNYSTMFHDPNADIQASFIPSTSSGYGNGSLIDESFAQPLNLDDGSWEQLLSLMEAPSSSPDNDLVNKSFRPPPMSSPYVAQKSNLMQSIMKSPPESNWNRVQHKSSYQIMPPPMDQSHYASIPKHHNNLPYMNTDGFPVCYDSHYNLNNTHADKSSVIRSSSQFAPLTPQPFKRSHQHSAEIYHSLDQTQSQYKTIQQDNLMASKINYSSHFAPATPQPPKPVEVYQSPATQKQDIVPGSAEIELLVDSSSTAKETGEIQNIDLNVTPSLKAPRRKKHRPKVIRENKPPRKQNQVKEKVGPDGTPVPKRKYVRKTPQEKIKDSATKPPLKSCRKSLHFDLEDNFGDTLNQVDLQKNIFQDVIAQQSNQSENNVNGYQILQEITVQQELQKTRQIIEEIQRRRVSQYIQSRASKRDYILASHGISTNTTNSQLLDQCYSGAQKRKRIENLSLVQLNGYPVNHFVSDDSNPKSSSGWIDLIRQPISSASEIMLAEKEARMSALANVINPNLQNQISQHANSRTQRQITETTNNSNHAIVPMKKHKEASILCKPAANKTGKRRKQKKTVSVDDITDQLKCLNLNSTNSQLLEDDLKALVPYKGDGTIVLYDDPVKKQKFWPKVDLDPETNRLWNLLMGKEASVNEQQTDEQKTEWWEEQRKIFRGRADSFIARMHLVQGDRRFSPWKGSVVDSVIGVFLTQNVTDHLSSSAFMSLAAQFPPQSIKRDTDLQKPAEVSIQSLDELVSSQDSTESSIVHINGSVTADCLTHSCQSISRYSTMSFIIEEMENNSRFPNFRSQDSGSLNYKTATDKTCPFDLNREAGDLVLSDTDGRHYISLQSTSVSKDMSVASIATESSAQKSILTAEEPTLSESNVSNIKGKKAEGVKKSKVDWDWLRRQVKPEGEQKERSQNTMDSIDYGALHHAHVSKIAETIKPRGMNNMLAERIKEFLDRILKDHGSMDLEWLRDAPPDKSKDYLLSINGLGLKSVECIRLLTLHQHAFPVDTNVGRIAVRLGWVPLQPLPESLQLHLLEQYPILESVQKYLYPRLCNLDQPTLYELHYQLITFGKVFCTKTKPNCNACPMRGECRHFASAFASSRLALPGPEEKSIVTTIESPTETRRDAATNINLLLLPPLQDKKTEETTTLAKRTCEPIVEEPSTPEPEISDIVDIEEAFYDDPDEIPTIKLNVEEFTQNLQIFMQDGDMSKALVAFDPQLASIPTQKLKNVSRLRTEHQVYQLPDSHPLLKELDKREPDDPSPYLLAIWTPGETANSIQPPEGICNSRESGQLCSETSCFTCNSVRESNAQTVRGTILIPCRTATRGSFPLNGTYFQVNEVFADHESSLKPIDVPREWIWNLPRSTVYFGTSVSAIFRGMSTEEIQQCFWRGFVCVRGFDKQTRIPRPLIARLHFSASKQMREDSKEGKIFK